MDDRLVAGHQWILPGCCGRPLMADGAANNAIGRVLGQYRPFWIVSRLTGMAAAAATDGGDGGKLNTSTPQLDCNFLGSRSISLGNDCHQAFEKPNLGMLAGVVRHLRGRL